MLNKRELKYISKELIWAAVMLINCLIFCIASFGLDNFKSGKCEIHLHDTYLVLSSISILLGLFIFLLFFSLLIRTILYNFRNRITNILLISATALMILLSTLVVQKASKLSFFESGWAIYPPLSALPEEVGQNDISSKFSNIIIVGQLFLISILIIACIKTAKNGPGRKSKTS